MTDTAIAIRELRKAFQDQKILDGINLQVARGETVAVLGRSGGGKSVLLKLLIRLQAPDSGSVRLAGEEISDLDDKQLNQVRKKVGFLFQQAALYDSLTVEENVVFPLTRHTDRSIANQKQRARELLAEVGMERDGEKLPAQISGGMQKRVGLARALALDPEILLLDEPTAGLDPITAAGIGDLIVDLKRKGVRSVPSWSRMMSMAPGPMPIAWFCFITGSSAPKAASRNYKEARMRLWPTFSVPIPKV